MNTYLWLSGSLFTLVVFCLEFWYVILLFFTGESFLICVCSIHSMDPGKYIAVWVDGSSVNLCLKFLIKPGFHAIGLWFVTHMCIEICLPDLSHFKYHSRLNWDEPQLIILSYMVTKLSVKVVEGSSLLIFIIPASWHIGFSISLTSCETKCKGIA